jgi:3-oxoacyl-[acyl-carrier protein] reductase
MALANGAKTAATDIDENALAGLRAETGNHADLVTDVMDVTDSEKVAQSLRRIKEKLGTVTALVCSAGVALEAPFLDITTDLWDRIITLNLTGTFLVAQAVARDMVAQGISGSIVTISSTYGVSGYVRGAHYSASKAALFGLTKSIALELAPYKIRANCVAPGGVETPLLRRVLAARLGTQARGGKPNPLGRFGQPHEIAATICFLLSNLSGWTTGQVLHVNGGSLLP